MRHCRCSRKFTTRTTDSGPRVFRSNHDGAAPIGEWIHPLDAGRNANPQLRLLRHERMALDTVGNPHHHFLRSAVEQVAAGSPFDPLGAFGRVSAIHQVGARRSRNCVGESVAIDESTGPAAGPLGAVPAHSFHRRANHRRLRLVARRETPGDRPLDHDERHPFVQRAAPMMARLIRRRTLRF